MWKMEKKEIPKSDLNKSDILYFLSSGLKSFLRQ